MAYARYESVAVNTAGDVIPNATIEVREDRAGRPVVPLWANREGTEPLGNPIKSDELGKFGFYAKGGSYYIRVFTGPSQQPFQQYVRRHQAIGTAAERDVEDLATALETGTATFATLAELEAFMPAGSGVGGKVYADPVAASNGYYSWDGAAWVWKRPLTDTLARLNVTGGTANEIVASLDPGVYGAHVAMLFIEPTGNNTAPVFVNGKEVRTVDNASLLAGQWLAGRTYWFTDEDAFYKLRNESDVSGLVAQAEQAAQDALQAKSDTDDLRGETEVLRDEAAGFAAGLNIAPIAPGDAGKLLQVNAEEDGSDWIVLPSTVPPDDAITEPKLSRGLSARVGSLFDSVAGLLADTTFSYSNIPVGTIIEAQGFRYEVAASAATGPFIISTAGGVKIDLRGSAINGLYNVLAWGVVPGGAAKADNYELIQQALDTQRNIVIPPGHYYSTGTFALYQGQRVVGGGGNYVNKSRPTETLFTFAKDTSGWEGETNIAFGCSLENVFSTAEDTTYGSGSIGIRFGKKGMVGGLSQAVKCKTVDCTFEGFDVNSGTYGWAWEVCYIRTAFTKGRTLNSECDDAFTMVTYDNCSWLEAGMPYGTDPARLSSAAKISGPNDTGSGRQVLMIHPRFENNLQGGIIADGNVRLQLDTPHFESNRSFDIQLSGNFRGTFLANGGAYVHDNVQVTQSCIRVISDKKCSVIINGPTYSLGFANENTINDGFILIGSTAPYVEVNGILPSGDLAKMITGDKKIVYASRSGSYAPQKFTIAGLTGVFMRMGNSHMAHLNFRNANLIFTDAVSSIDLLTTNSIAFDGGNMYRWDGAAWVLKTP